MMSQPRGQHPGYSWQNWYFQFPPRMNTWGSAPLLTSPLYPQRDIHFLGQTSTQRLLAGIAKITEIQEPADSQAAQESPTDLSAWNPDTKFLIGRGYAQKVSSSWTLRNTYLTPCWTLPSAPLCQTFFHSLSYGILMFVQIATLINVCSLTLRTFRANIMLTPD